MLDKCYIPKYYIDFKNINYESIKKSIEYIDDATDEIKKILKKNTKNKEDIEQLTYFFDYIIIFGRDGYNEVFNNIKSI